MNYMELDTPALIIDREIMMDNLRFMQDYADRKKVALGRILKLIKCRSLR